MWLESKYGQMPEWAQDLLITAGGVKLRQQRSSHAYREEYDLIKATEKASPLQLELLQVSRLRRLLNSIDPMQQLWGHDYRKHNFDLLRAGDWSSFQELPLTKRSDSDTRSNNSNQIVRNQAYLDRFFEQSGVSLGSRSAVFHPAASIVNRPELRIWRKDWINRKLLLSTQHLSRENLSQYLEALNEFRPTFIDGFPSALELLARELMQQGRMRIPIETIFTCGETLHTGQRDIIESAFRAKVFDSYRDKAMSSFWFECRYRRMHAHPLYGVTEIVRLDGSPCRAGEMGEVVTTSLISGGHAEIRCRTGDRAVWSDAESCPCGRSMPILDAIEGKRDQALFSPERQTWLKRSSGAFLPVGGILEYQLEQISPALVRVSCVAGRDFSESSKMQLESQLQSSLGRETRVAIEMVSMLRRDENGKLPTIVSNLSDFEVEKPHCQELA